MLFANIPFDFVLLHGQSAVMLPLNTVSFSDNIILGIFLCLGNFCFINFFQGLPVFCQHNAALVTGPRQWRNLQKALIFLQVSFAVLLYLNSDRLVDVIHNKIRIPASAVTVGNGYHNGKPAVKLYILDHIREMIA